MAKFNDIRELAQQNARWVSNSPKDWMNYLDVAARLYRYSFKDTLLIHAQRPDATACVELEVWNKKMNRWVNRGAKGIALLDDASPRAKLRYVFDIADTHLVQGGKTPILWRIDYSEHQQMILDHLADTYALTQTDSMNAALMELAQQLTAENLEEAMDGLEYEVADTFLEGLDEDNLRVCFRELMTNSIFYTLSRRCGQEPLEVLDDEDFIRIVDFNQLPVLTFLGNAVSEQCEAVLRDIGREMQKIYRKEVTEHLAKTADSLYNTSTDFSTLKRETETNITEGGKPYGTDLSPQGGLPVSEPDRTGQADEHWEVRDAAQDLSEGEQEELVSEYADERQAESASGADRRAGGEPDGRTDREPEREVSGSEQGNRTDGMGGTPEQSDRDGGRDRAEGIGIQLTADTTEQDLSEAEEEIASAFSLPSLPTVEQQIRAIEAPMQAQYADEITIPAEVVDEILRTGSNRNKSQLRLIYNFMTEQSPEEYTAFVKKEYGEGGKGFEIGGTKYAVWFDELGMQIAVGDTVRNDPKNKAFLSWEDVSGRIHQLLQQGEYAPKSVLDAARGNALHEHAEALSYMERDMSEGVAEMVFADTSIFSGGYPELTERLAKLLDQPEFLADLNERLLGLAEAYAEDKSVMRMQFYRPDKVSERFQKFALPYQPYQAREGFQWNEQEVFITEDEINAFLAGGGPYSDGRLATYSFFLTHTEKAERAAFLKDRYGVGGSSHALSRADNSHASYDGRGLELARGIYGKPDALVKLNWNQAAERVAKLIDQSLYLKPADYSRMPSYEREQMVNRVIGFYHRLPDEVERPFKRELLNEDARKKLPTMLADPEQAVELLEKMDAALLSVPLDSPEYAEKSKTLAELHQYVEGTYTIFPEKKKAVEISVSETGQISLFDIWAQEQESKEHSTTAVVEEPQKQAAKYSRNVGDYLYLEDDRLYKIERVTDFLIYLKDMERPAWAARVLRPNQYDAELAKNPLNDYLLAGQKSALKDSRCVYKECLYSMLDAVQQSEIYPYLRDRDVDADEAEKELRNKIDELLEQNAKTAPLYLEASQNWENFKDWLVEDIFQHTYQDVITDRRDAVALYQDSKDAPQWVRGIMVPYAAEEKAVEPTLQPLPLDAVNEYNALKERYPDALVGYEQYGNFEFYGEDAKRVSELLGSKLLEKETALGKVEVSGFPREQWVSQAMKLWKQGESVYLSGQQEDGTHAQTKYFRREEYLPVNTIIELDDREFRVDSVNFEQGTVSLQDMTLAKEARYPIFRTEPLEYIRHLYEQADVPMEEAVEITVFTALHNAGVAYEDFSPEQMDVIYSVAESGGELEELLNPDFSPEQMQLIADVQTRTDAIHRSAVDDVLNPLTSKPMTPEEVNHARRQHNLPLDSGAETEQPAQPKQEPMNFRITDDDLGAGGAKTKFKANIEAIRLLQTLDAEQRQATAEEQEVLSRYVGWGGIPQAFDEKNADWVKEYAELKSLLPADEYSEARASTLNAFYTSPTVIKAMYEALSNMGLSKGNVLEPSCGVGNFMGLVPESMENIKMYGVELDNVSGRIAQQLYQKNKIAVQGFETMQFPDSFFDCVVGNVPFGNYKVPDKRYDRHNFLIHDYFIAKSLDLVRPGGVVAVVTSSGTMDKKDSSVREYLANRADLVGAIRLPNNAFQRNANTSVVADILFLQKRDRAAVERAEWVDLGTTPEGYPINQYFAQHPEMVLGEITTESTQYGKQETTVKPIEGADLAQQLKAAVENIHAEITEPEITDDELDQNAEPLPADPNVKNFSYTNVDGQVYYRENSYMNKVDLPAVTAERVLGMIALRETTQKLLDCQLHDGTDAEVELLQGKLKDQYKRFTAQYGLINSTANKRAFRQDSSYCLLASLEILDEDKNLKRLADIFTKRTIRKPEPVTSVDTPSEALALSIGEKAKVDVPFMAELCGKTEQEVTEELAGVIFRNPVTQAWVTADEYLSGNVREKLATAETFAANHLEYQVNVEYEQLQEIEIFDKPGLFSNGRLRDEDVPDGLYRYDLRGSDYDPGQPILVEKTVIVNHAASILMAEELDLGADGRLELGEEGLNFTGAELTVREFMEEQQQKRSGLIHGDSDHIAVEGHIGTWYAVDETEIGGEKFFLLEHEEHGDMAACVAVNEQGKLVAEDLWNGFDEDFQEAVQKYLSEKWNMPKKEDVVSEIIEKAAPVPDNSAQDYSDVPVYYEPFSYAKENDEVDLYRTSYRLNSECKQAIHEAIADNYDGMYLGDDAVDQVVRQYGMERVGYILANTLHHKSYDGRFSHSNKEWAEQVSTPEHNADRMTFRTDWVVDSHPAILDGFVTMFRKELDAQKEQEQPFVKQFYVVENLQAAPLRIERFGNLDDAMSQYQELPNHYMKALGVEKNPDPLPGSLDVLQCRNGIDTIVEDYKTVPGWDNPYIQNHVVQPLQVALAVQDVELAYELPDAYFHIQTCDDGFDYTLYNKDFTVMDGGIVETDEYRPVQEVMEEVLAEHGHSISECGVISAEYLQEQSYRAETQRAEAMKEKLAAEKPAPEASISFYVAECAEFPVMGEFHDNLTLEQALEVYDKIPAERMNGIKSIGFSLEDGSIYSGMFDLMVGGEVQAEVVNHIQHYRESPLVQKAISDMKTLLEKRQASKELEERPNTRQSVREALKNRKKAQEQQSNQEQAKPKKAKKKGEMEL